MRRADISVRILILPFGSLSITVACRRAPQLSYFPSSSPPTPSVSLIQDFNQNQSSISCVVGSHDQEMWPFLESVTIPFFPPNWLSQPLPSSDSPSSIQPTPLCSVCRTAIQEGPKTTPRSQFGILVPHHKTVSSFRESVEQGCHLCTVFWHKIPPAGRDILGRIRLDNCVTLLSFLPGNGPNNITLGMKVSPSVSWWSLSWKILMGQVMDAAEAPTALFTLQPAQSMAIISLLICMD